ncbi:probable galacturonosyltransferase 4 [Amborella trichopoda]|uniref:Hexosyltransferase n=1 Tax=Amborella trichopoda TaxID=13333 RepID=U5DFA9_AMBTC|nr:probable galacturonosyltransferase 4 [Amborella trichopoda]ERN19093.1 hypothetical protein AMTR_s00061p00126570 [Amborella trichopoda]|eukprot:XP_006857626.1 probable galacturonosyltransferase 4 [Amborella trichopoda]
MKFRMPVLLLLCFSVLAPIVLYTDRLGSFSSSIAKAGFSEEFSPINYGRDINKLKVLPQESVNALKEPSGVVYLSDKDPSEAISVKEEPKMARSRVLQSNVKPLEVETHIEQVIDKVHREEKNGQEIAGDSQAETIEESQQVLLQSNEQKIGAKREEQFGHQDASIKEEIGLSSRTDAEKQEPDKPEIESGKSDPDGPSQPSPERQNDNKKPMPDARVHHLRDQLIKAKVYLSLGTTRSNPHFIKELRVRIREVQRALGDATKDSELPRGAYDKLKAMEETLAKGKQIQDDCAAVIKKLRAILHSTEEQLRVHKKQSMFLMQLSAKTLPKGLHCLPLRLTTEYYSLNSTQQQFPNQEKLENPNIYHYALFSDNVLAAAVVVNSTVSNARDPRNHVFHIVTDRLNYAAMRMWFIANPPGKATIQVQSVEEFTWLNSSYSPVLKQLGSTSMIDYYFRTHRANPDSNLKYRNPKYLSILNHLRFYMPEIFPKLHKVLFLDDDIVVQRDLTQLWKIDLKGKINGAVETCRESFHRFDRYLNFSNPLISKNFEAHACGWAFGMNIFDLKEWKKQEITEIYHSWQKLNNDRQLWKLGTLPPGLITFYNRTFPLNRGWHVLGLGYDPSVNQRDIQRAAAIHYNGNLKPWLEIGLPKFRGYWQKYINYNQPYLQDCNINP